MEGEKELLGLWLSESEGAKCWLTIFTERKTRGVEAPLLEALAKEEEGQEGTAKGRGAVFRLMLATLEVADPAKAEQVKSGLPTDAVLDSVRAGAVGRTRDVTKLAKNFAAYLPWVVF